MIEINSQFKATIGTLLIGILITIWINKNYGALFMLGGGVFGTLEVIFNRQKKLEKKQ